MNNIRLFNACYTYLSKIVKTYLSIVLGRGFVKWALYRPKLALASSALVTYSAQELVFELEFNICIQL